MLPKNKKHLHSLRGKFGNSQAKVSKDIEWTPLGQHVDRQLQKCLPLIFKRGIISFDVLVNFGLTAQT